jgi:hypothetical protein
MQHDLQDQWRALQAEQRAAEEAFARAHEALAKRIEQARGGGKDLRPLPEVMQAKDRASEALADARASVERFRKLHPEVR